MMRKIIRSCVEIALEASNLCPSETGGPIVKTGPTAGQNRSRNKNGRWRKKRSDTGTKRN